MARIKINIACENGHSYRTFSRQKNIIQTVLLVSFQHSKLGCTSNKWYFFDEHNIPIKYITFSDDIYLKENTTWHKSALMSVLKRHTTWINERLTDRHANNYSLKR